MKTFLNFSRVQLCFSAISVLLLGALMSPAFAFKATGGLTGWWEQPNQQNHGLIIAIATLESGEQTGTAFWAHYDDEGNPTWLIAQGPLDEDTIEADLYQVRGINFMQASGSESDPEELVGTLTIEFKNCNRGEVDYDTTLATVGSGEFRIERLTTIPGVDCTGGVSDNLPPSAVPERFEIDLQPAEGFGQASGEVEAFFRPGSAEFEVEIEQVQEGVYTLFVGGTDRGSFDAVIDDDDNLAEGEIEFRSPQRRDDLLLDFDPRGQTLEIFNSDDQLVLSVDVPEAGSPVNNAKAPPFGDDGTTVEMTNAGVYPDGEAEAELERDPRTVSFEIEVEDIPAGDYLVCVDTDPVGTISVVVDDDDTEGEIEFRDPATPGYEAMTFDPRGALIEIREDACDETGTAIFFIEAFPGASAGDDSDRPGPGGEHSGPDLEVVYGIPNQGVYPGAESSAVFYRDEDGREFEVEIEDVPAGNYTLEVGGQERGTIVAAVDEDDDDDDDFSAEGEIEFANPNFSISGESIRILEGNSVIFEGLFPNLRP